LPSLVIPDRFPRATSSHTRHPTLLPPYVLVAYLEAAERGTAPELADLQAQGARVYAHPKVKNAPEAVVEVTRFLIRMKEAALLFQWPLPVELPDFERLDGATG
jgi:hypothetical protein